MRRLALPLAGLAALALAGVLAVGLAGDGELQTRAEQAALLASELRCPDCQSLSVAESRTTAAQAIRAEIDEQLAAGATMDQVRSHFVERYGEWILLAPRGALPWLVPGLALLLGLGLLVGWWMTRAPRGAEEPAPVSEADRQRVRDEAEALDA
jgi:cytochrome c-type biogenesis protein CcmH